MLFSPAIKPVVMRDGNLYPVIVFIASTLLNFAVSGKSFSQNNHSRPIEFLSMPLLLILSEHTSDKVLRTLHAHQTIS